VGLYLVTSVIALGTKTQTRSDWGRGEQKHKHEVIGGEGHHALRRRQRAVDLDSGEAAADEIMQTALTYDAKLSNSAYSLQWR
jgi:hypothetical protein